jgi:hypothetical protein
MEDRLQINCKWYIDKRFPYILDILYFEEEAAMNNGKRRKGNAYMTFLGYY